VDDNKVAVLIENLMSQFRTFGEGLDGLGDEMKAFRGETNHRLNNLEQKVIEIKLEVSELKAENKKEHQQLIQAVKELDTEVVKLKRVK
jgi:hypothetical protein